MRPLLSYSTCTGLLAAVVICVVISLWLWWQDDTNYVSRLLTGSSVSRKFGFFPPQTSYWDMLIAHWYLAPSLAGLILLYLCGIFDRNNAPNMYPLF